MKKVAKVECRGHGDFLLAKITDATGGKHELAFDAAMLTELLRFITGAGLSSESAAIRDALRPIAARTVRVEAKGGAIPMLIQRLEAGVAFESPMEREELEQLHRDCEDALEAAHHRRPPRGH